MKNGKILMAQLQSVCAKHPIRLNKFKFAKGDYEKKLKNLEDNVKNREEKLILPQNWSETSPSITTLSFKSSHKPHQEVYKKIEVDSVTPATTTTTTTTTTKTIVATLINTNAEKGHPFQEDSKNRGSNDTRPEKEKPCEEIAVEIVNVGNTEPSSSFFSKKNTKKNKRPVAIEKKIKKTTQLRRQKSAQEQLSQIKQCSLQLSYLLGGRDEYIEKDGGVIYKNNLVYFMLQLFESALGLCGSHLELTTSDKGIYLAFLSSMRNGLKCAYDIDLVTIETVATLVEKEGTKIVENSVDEIQNLALFYEALKLLYQASCQEQQSLTFVTKTWQKRTAVGSEQELLVAVKYLQALFNDLTKIFKSGIEITKENLRGTFIDHSHALKAAIVQIYDVYASCSEFEINASCEFIKYFINRYPNIRTLIAHNIRCDFDEITVEQQIDIIGRIPRMAKNLNNLEKEIIASVTERMSFASSSQF